MNRAILAGSVIVGIAVMMSISVTAPAFAANPWRDAFVCKVSEDPETLGGTKDWIETNLGDQEEKCSVSDTERVGCTSKSGDPGHVEFKDSSPYEGEREVDEHDRCHKSNFWILS